MTYHDHLLSGASRIELKGEGDPPADDPNAIVTKALDDLRGTVDDRFKALETKAGALETKAGDLDKLVKRLDVIEVKVNRPGAGEKKPDEQAELEKKAFTTFLRHGREALGADEIKCAARVGRHRGRLSRAGRVLARGGQKHCPVQPGPAGRACRRDRERQRDRAASHRPPDRGMGWRNGDAIGDRVQLMARSKSRSTKSPATSTCSNKLLEDAAVDVAAEVAFDLAEEFGRAEGEAFITGNGVKKPLGLLSDTGLCFTVSGSAAAVTDADGGANGLIDLFYALAPFYRQRGVWMANGTTIAALRKMKDSQKQYLWQPAVAVGQPETFLGRPIVEAVDLPDIGAGTFPLLFGDFASAFRIYDRITLSLLRDPYSQATSGLTRFHARRRVGARVVRAEAVAQAQVLGSVRRNITCAITLTTSRSSGCSARLRLPPTTPLRSGRSLIGSATTASRI